MGIEIINPAGVGAEKTVIVLGLGRGGTSAMSGILRILGVAMPDTTHPLKHEWSPVVYDGVVVDRDKTRLRIAEIDDKHSVWGWKSPKDIFTVGQFETMLCKPHYIVIFRNVFDVCASSKRYEGLPYEALMPDVAAVLSEIARFISTNTSPLALASFERVVADPVDTVRELADWLDISPSDETLDRVIRFVSEKRYRALNGNRSIHAEEIVADAERGRRRIYGERIRELGQRIAAIEVDAAAARQILNSVGDEANVTVNDLELKYKDLRRQLKAMSERRASLQQELDARHVCSSAQPELFPEDVGQK